MRLGPAAFRLDERIPRWLPIIGAALAILGAKLILIKSLGAEVPYWDQWDGEAAHLYKPYLEGTLTWHDLIASHNEHRIVASRLWSLALLELNGLWSPKLQMVANAVLHSSILALLLLWLTRGLGTAQRLFLCLLMAAVYATPFGWGNTLAGFQSQFYLVFGFSMASLWAFSAARPFSSRWLAGLLLSTAAYFSMASGALTLVAVIALLGLQVAFGIRPRSLPELASLALLSLVTIAMVAFVTPVAGHDSLKADGFVSFVTALLEIASWPVPNVVLGAFLLNAPIAVLFVKALAERRPISDPVWAGIAVMFWLGTQWLSFSYGRAIAPLASRYLDTFTIGIIVNCAAALHLWRETANRWVAAWLVVGLSVFATAVVSQAAPKAFHGAVKRHAHYVEQTNNLSAYLRTGDRSHLENKAHLALPYPDSNRLAIISNDPSVRKILHPRLTGDKVAKLSLPTWIVGTARKLQIGLLRLGPLLFFVGVAVLGYGILRHWDRRAEPNL